MVIKGIKTHEYRLATKERKNISIGDTIVLISNSDKSKYINVVVKNITYFQNWEDALKEYWAKDFQDLYDTYAAALKECYKFYKKEDVEKYGIVVFDIEPISINYLKCTILLDTNILIRRESSNNVSFEIAELYKWFEKLKVEKYIHELSQKEILSHKDSNVRNNMSIKLSSYRLISNKYISKDSFFEEILNSCFTTDSENDLVDNELLKTVYSEVVDILVTDDKEIIRKAKKLYIKDRVLSSSELLKIYEQTEPSYIEYKMLKVKLERFNKINLNDGFFKTLKEDYGERDFEKWFIKKANNNDRAYIFEIENRLTGFLYLKLEDKDESYIDLTPKFEPKKRLKIGTFKIVRTNFRLGERFLKIIFDNAIKLDVDEIYVTMFENKRKEVAALKKMLEKWGFYRFGYKDNGEIVLIKNMREYNYKKQPKYNYPLIKNNAEYFFLPIDSMYHTKLFPDNILENEDMHLYEDNKPFAYATEKIYLTGAQFIRAKPGDLVLIYRNGDRYPKKYSSVITGIAIIEDILHPNNVEECINECKDKSIFSTDEIRKLYPKYPVVVKLLSHTSFENKVILNYLYDNHIVKINKGPRPFEKISKCNFEKIQTLGTEKKDEQ